MAHTHWTVSELLEHVRETPAPPRVVNWQIAPDPASRGVYLANKWGTRIILDLIIRGFPLNMASWARKQPLVFSPIRTLLTAAYMTSLSQVWFWSHQNDYFHLIYANTAHSFFWFFENSFLAVYQNPFRSVWYCNNWKRLLKQCNFTPFEFGFPLIGSYLGLFVGGTVFFPLTVTKSCFTLHREILSRSNLRCPKSLTFDTSFVSGMFMSLFVYVLLTTV